MFSLPRVQTHGDKGVAPDMFALPQSPSKVLSGPDAHVLVIFGIVLVLLIVLLVPKGGDEWLNKPSLASRVLASACTSLSELVFSDPSSV